MSIYIPGVVSILPSATMYFSNSTNIIPKNSSGFKNFDNIESAKQVGLIRLGFQGWNPYYILFLFIIAYETRRIMVIFRKQRPSNVKVTGTDSLIGNWLTSIRYCYASQSVHNKAYFEGGGEPYAIPTRNRYQVCVSTQKLVEELGSASIHQVSLRDALWERAFPGQTIDGLPLHGLDNNGNLSQKVYRHLAREHMPGLQPIMQKRLSEAFASEIDSQKKKGDWTYVSSSGAINRLLTKINNILIVGDSLASNSNFFENTVRYVHLAGACEEILQYTPQLLCPLVGWLLMKATRVIPNLNKHLVPQARERLNNKVAKEDEPKDAMQWIINSRKHATAEEVAQQTLAYIFGGAYQMPMLQTFSLYNLCKHPEYLEPLRKEISRAGGVHFNLANNELPLLDSFLKETARMNPVTIFGMPRKIMTPFTFSNGVHVPANNWIVVPQQRQMLDPNYYEDPETFNGFRFVKQENGENVSESRLSHPSWRFPFWGSVKQACPARFYVTDMTKLIIKEFIMNYDITLADENIPNSFAFGPLRVPHPRLAFLMKKRSVEVPSI